MNNNTINDNNSYNICLEYIDENFYINYTDINSQSFNISNINIESNKNDIDNFYEQIINYSLYQLNITNNNYGILSNLINNTEDNSFNSDISQLISDSDINEPITIIFFNNSQIEKINQTIENIINNLIYEFNTSELDNGIDKKITDKNKEIVLTTTNNQKKNEDKNNVTLNLGQCEDILKKAYNISKNEPLYILEIISKEEGMKIPKLEYEVYYPLYNCNNLTKLDLNLCKDSKIEISIAVSINDSLDKYNPKSSYYNDICSKATSESGTDIPLKDRMNEFVENNMTLCEENCDLIDYDKIRGKAKCSCDIKSSISSYDDIKFNKNDFFKSFTDINNILNIKIVKCYNIILKIKDLINNYGFIIISSAIIIYFLLL